MAKKKRVTLPKNFRELVEAGDMEMLKAVYEQGELSVLWVLSNPNPIPLGKPDYGR